MDGLPEPLRQGLFAGARSYPVVVRLAHLPGERLDGRKVSTPRGMALKVFGAEGPKLPIHEGELTQDFVLDTGKVFNTPGAGTLLAAITATEAAGPMPQVAKQAVPSLSRVADEALNGVGLNGTHPDFYGHPFTHPLSEAYYTQAPIRYGDYVAKLGVMPDTPDLAGSFEPQDEDGLRTAVVAFFRTHPAEFVVGVQLCTDLDAMPVEDASAEWPEELSPYRPVARLILPVQDAYTPERQAAAEEDLSFCPAHSLVAHQPLGSLMRARMRAYEALGRARRAETGRPAREPRSIDEVRG